MSARVFKEEQEFLNKFEEYINYCEANKRLANIAGFAVYCKSFLDVRHYGLQDHRRMFELRWYQIQKFRH